MTSIFILPKYDSPYVDDKKYSKESSYLKRYIGLYYVNENVHFVVSTIRYTWYKRDILQRIIFSLEHNLLCPILNNRVGKYRAICLPGKRKEVSGEKHSFVILKRNPYRVLFWELITIS